MLKEKLLNEANNDQNIYISIDHLKKGTYQLKIVLKNKVIKTFIVDKED